MSEELTLYFSPHVMTVISAKGPWSATADYVKGDLVSDSGYSYIAIQNVPAGTALTNASYWQVLSARGPQGDTGVGISNIALNNDYTLTITYTDDTTVTTPPIRGATGNGIASAVLNDDYTLTLTFTDGNTYTTPSIRGAKGDPGVGVMSIYKTGQSGLDPIVDEYTILYSDNTMGSFTVTNGRKGDKGNPGVSPSIAITAITGGHRVAVTDEGGTDTFDVMDGADATVDATLTQAGEAADAKATGDAIAATNTNITTINAGLTNVNGDMAILRAMEKGSLTWAQIKSIVQGGRAQNWFAIGDQISVTWTDSNGTDHSLPFDVVSFDPVTKENEQSASPGMWLQSHYAMEAVQFDQNEAFYVLPEALPAGTYHFTFGSSWGSKDVVEGDSYSFTTTEAYAAGAQFVVGSANNDRSSLPDTLSSTWRIRTYAAATDTTPTEVLPVTAGASGTSLGSISTAIKYSAEGLNNLHRAGYGYNRWSMSAMRQWLNSAADAGSWWAPTNPFDRAPEQLASLKGFLTGFDNDFLSVIGSIAVTTALNTVSDSEIGTSEVTYDKFFLPSLEQEYITPQLSGVEGNYWPYWKSRLGLNAPQATGSGGANANHIRYAYDAQTTAQYCRLRSASRSGASYPWTVYTSGYAGTTYAAYASRGCPACVIC